MSSDPPRYDLLPLTVQRAMRLRGALVDCGPGLRGIAWPEVPRVRLTAIASALQHGRVAAYLTAAWVWQAATHPGSPLSIASLPGSSRHEISREYKRYELRLNDRDISTFGELCVTTPQRTMLDLLYRPESYGAIERDACLKLFEVAGIDADETNAMLARRRRPHGRLARERFREILMMQEPGSPRLDSNVSEGVDR